MGGLRLELGRSSERRHEVPATEGKWRGYARTTQSSFVFEFGLQKIKVLLGPLTGPVCWRWQNKTKEHRLSR